VKKPSHPTLQHSLDVGIDDAFREMPWLVIKEELFDSPLSHIYDNWL
jgi:hypothetical protein